MDAMRTPHGSQMFSNPWPEILFWNWRSIWMLAYHLQGGYMQVTLYIYIYIHIYIQNISTICLNNITYHMYYPWSFCHRLLWYTGVYEPSVARKLPMIAFWLSKKAAVVWPRLLWNTWSKHMPWKPVVFAAWFNHVPVLHGLYALKCICVKLTYSGYQPTHPAQKREKTVKPWKRETVKTRSVKTAIAVKTVKTWKREKLTRENVKIPFLARENVKSPHVKTWKCRLASKKPFGHENGKPRPFRLWFRFLKPDRLPGRASEGRTSSKTAPKNSLM